MVNKKLLLSPREYNAILIPSPSILIVEYLLLNCSTADSFLFTSCLISILSFFSPSVFVFHKVNFSHYSYHIQGKGERGGMVKGERGGMVKGEGGKR